MFMLRPKALPVLCLAILYSGTVIAQGVKIPVGTTVYGELDQSVTSKKRKTAVGDIIRSHVWRDVLVDGHIVVKAGAPMVLRVSHAKSAGVAGRKGSLELEAVSVRAVDDSDILLDGGYDKSGKSRIGLSIALFAVVAWPLIFLKGKQATLEAGTVFDCTVQSDSDVIVERTGPTPIRIRLSAGEALAVEVLYDEVDPEGKDKALPVIIRSRDATVDVAAVVTVNGQDIDPLPLSLQESYQEGESTVVKGTIDLEKLGTHLRKGINRFEVEVSGKRAEIILDVEL